jgi:hypothetical protein
MRNGGQSNDRHALELIIPPTLLATADEVIEYPSVRTAPVWLWHETGVLTLLSDICFWG